jgi:hypothetical protein
VTTENTLIESLGCSNSDILILGTARFLRRVALLAGDGDQRRHDAHVGGLVVIGLRLTTTGTGSVIGAL